MKNRTCAVSVDLMVTYFSLLSLLFMVVFFTL